MARRSRRARRKMGRGRRFQPPVASPVPPRANEERAPAGAEIKPIALAEEYPYVYQDLKRIALLAGTMFAILVILTLVVK